MRAVLCLLLFTPLTSLAKPDLSGVWNFSTLTPLERPVEFGDKAVLTPSEAQALLQKVLPPDKKDEPYGVAKLDVEVYNDFWFDAGQELDVERRTSLIIDPPNGRLPKVLPEAEAHRLAQNKKRKFPVRALATFSVGPDYPHEHPESLGLSERCLVGFNAGPPITPSFYNNNLRIVQTEAYVMLMTEMVHDVRIIPLDGRSHLPEHIHQWLGVPRGHWDGDTLVVETKNFTDKVPAFTLPVNLSVQEVNGALGSGTDLHVTERFSLTEAGLLKYEATRTAPKTFVMPFTMRVYMRPTRDKIYEYACHEANYGMEGILKGVRRREADGEI
ncbi:MAG: hypothetical protein AAF541_10285 [Pseudomonadota bacterium]